jgi:hypothetical protein
MLNVSLIRLVILAVNRTAVLDCAYVLRMVTSRN